MKIEFNGIIKTDQNSLLRFSKPVIYLSPSGINSSIKNNENDNTAFVVTLNIESQDINEGKALADAEIMRLANLLSWKNQIKIISAKINGYQHLGIKGNKNTVMLTGTISLRASFSIMRTIGEESVNLLSQLLSSNVSDEVLDIITLWKDANDQESDITKFFLLYRILEDLYKSRKNVDKWIIARDPNIEQKRTKDGMATIYTYLRDNIHPKKENKRFPFKDVADYLPKLQGLVKDSITENFPDAKI